jgi:hypothetical protein
MAKKDPVADALTKVAELRRIDDPRELSAAVIKLMGQRSSFVVSRVADLAAERSVRDAVPAMIERLDQLLTDGASDDVGAGAVMSLVKALVALEAGYEAEEVAIRASKHTRWEKVMGGSVEVAGSVRGNAAILLAAMGSMQAMRVGTELLAEADQRPPRERTSWPVRSDAARALTMIGSDGAAAILRFKILIGDAEPNVLSDCLAGLLAIERDAAIPLAQQMLDDDRDEYAEAAVLALGNWRDPRAFEQLRSRADRFLSSHSQELYLASIAMTRQPKAIDYLIELATDGNASLKRVAMNALEPLRLLPGVAERLEKLD